MYENEIEIEYIDAEGMRFLEGIEPFPEIVEALEDIAANNVFMYHRKPWIEMRLPNPDDGVSFGEDDASLPSIELHVLDAGTSVFELLIHLERCRYTMSGNTVETEFSSSRFHQMFYTGEFLKAVAVKTDIKTIARMVTYYLKLFGYTEDDCWVARNMYFNSGRSQHALLPHDMEIPEMLTKALMIVEAMKLEGSDSVMLMLTTPDGRNLTEPFELQVDSDDGGYRLEYYSHFEDRAELERRKQYRNSDFLDWMLLGNTCSGSLIADVNQKDDLLLLLDYFLFLNPEVRLEDIMVSLDFSIPFNNALPEGVRLEVAEMGTFTYSLYPDGTMDPGDKLPKYATAVYRARAIYRQWLADHPEVQGYLQ